MKLLVTGGTGFIGAPLRRRLAQRGHELLVLTRAPAAHRAESGVRFLPLDADAWRRELAGVGGVINLAGEPIAAGRWTARRKRAIRDSRVETTRRLVDALAAMPQRPAVLLNASAIGYYGARGDEELTESDGAGNGFLAETCQAWEAEARRAEALGVRVVRLRIGLVLGRGGGVLAKMTPPFRAFAGGPLGSGRQWMSWVHRDDVVGLIEWALAHAECSDALNVTAPEPVRMAAFCLTLGRALRRPSWAPVPAPVLRLLLGEMAEMLVSGQRVVPRATLRTGYPFRFPSLAGALEACLGHGADDGN